MQIVKLKKFLKKQLPEPLYNIIRDLSLSIKYKSENLNPQSILDFCTISNNSSIHYFNEDRITQICKPIYYPNNTAKCETIHMPPLYWTVLDNITIIGESNFIISEKKLLYDQYITNNINITDTAFLDKRTIYKLDENAIVYYNRFSNKKIETAISLVRNYSWNYYHFIFEFISQLWFLNQCNIPENIPIVIDNCIKGIPQYMEFLHILNKRPIIYLKRRERLRVEKMYFLSTVNIIPPNYIDFDRIKVDDNLFDSDFVKYLRNKMLPFAELNNTHLFERIFISRKNNKNRSYNESEVEQVVKKYGYISITPEGLSIKEQIAIFSHAKYIIAASGAALTNMIYCNPQCKIVVLAGCQSELSVFSNIASILDLKLIYLTGKSEIQDSFQSNFIIDIEKLDSQLINIGMA